MFAKYFYISKDTLKPQEMRILLPRQVTLAARRRKFFPWAGNKNSLARESLRGNGVVLKYCEKSLRFLYLNHLNSVCTDSLIFKCQS